MSSWAHYIDYQDGLAPGEDGQMRSGTPAISKVKEDVKKVPSRPKREVASSRLHKLTNIDPVARTAVCSVCGPIRIYRCHIWRCKNRHDADVAKYRGKK